MLNIRALLPNEIPFLAALTPPEWNTNLSITFSFHLGQPYFYPIAAELDEKFIGCANGLWNKNAGWLGNIVVAAEARGQGIGSALTRNLIAFFQSKEVTHQILIATKMGEPVYRKLGFETTSFYIFLKTEEPVSLLKATGVRPCKQEDYETIFHLDRSITGEERRPFLERFLKSGWVHESDSNELDGFFLPDLSQGPILAENDTAGLSLLTYKLSCGCKSIVIPESNTVALSFLQERNFQETARAPRMVLGRDTDWHPEHVYSRGGGYCG